MQKKLIALAVAAAISAPAFADNANVTVYGRVHTSLDSNTGNAGATQAAGTVNGLNLTSNSSRLGFKGSEDLGGDLKAVYQYETEVLAQGNAAAMLGAERDTYVGVAGGFGTVVAGRLPLANQYVGDANFMGDKVGDAGNLTAGGFGGLGRLAVPSRASRAIGYVSPTFAGVTITAGLVPNTPQSLNTTANSPEKDRSITLRAAYDNHGIFAAVTYLNLGVTGLNMTNGTSSPTGVPTATFADSGANIYLLSLAGGYDFGMAKVRAQYVSTTANSAAAGAIGLTVLKQDVITVGGQINIGNGAIKLQLATAQKAKLDNVAGTAVNDGTQAVLSAIAYEHNLSKRTSVYAAYAHVNNGVNSAFSATGYAHGGVGSPGASNSPSALSLGVIHNF